MWQHYGFPVMRLVRMAYGPFELGRLREGQVEEVPYDQVATLLDDAMDAGQAQGSSVEAPPPPPRRRRRESWAPPVPRLSMGVGQRRD